MEAETKNYNNPAVHNMYSIIHNYFLSSALTGFRH